MVRIVCASPAYRASRRAADPEQLPEHDGLDWDALAPPHAWRFERNGRSQLLRPGRLRMVANNAEALLAGALAGLGIAHLPTWLISEYRCAASCCRCSAKAGCRNRKPAASMPCA